MTLEVGTHIGKYVVRRKLAEGGMAEIYLCTARGAEGFEKEVVIKRVRAFLASDPEFVGMFIAEARLASRLNHANVVQIFDFDKHEDTYYLAMEYVRGCSLWELRKRCKELMEPVPPVMVAHIGTEVARGLHYAHRVKVNGQPLDLVHRDVTPHNVLLSFDGAVKLTDFGIAKAGNKLTQPGVLKGKFAYMSPEQARGEAVDARTDIFALGVVLWEMLTGGRLFDGDSEVAVLRAVQQSAIPPPARLNPDVPEDLDAVIVRALDREPAARFQTAGELERALAQCVLKHAKTVDDTDLSAFMRRLFPTSLTQALPTVQERTHVEDAPVPPGVDVRVQVPREPTAVMPGVSSGRGVAVAPTPDEDINAPTFVLPRRDEAEAAPSVPLPPMATPMMPLPAVASSPVPRPMPPVAAPVATVRPSRPEGTPAVTGEGSDAGAASGTPSGGRRPSPPEGVSSVSGRRPSQPDGVSSVSGRRPSQPDGVSSVGRNVPSAAPGVGAPLLEAASDDEAPDTVSSTGPDGLEAHGSVEAPARRAPSGGLPAYAQGPEKPVARRRPLALGLSAAVGLAVLGGGVAVMRFRAQAASTETAPASGSAATTAPGTGGTPPTGTSGTATAPAVKADVPARPSVPGSIPAGTGSAPVAARGDGSPDSDTAEVDGLKREEALGTEPRPAAGDSRPAAADTQDSQPAASTGTLQVRASPYATVFINGKRMGEVSGRASYKLSPGTYKLHFEHPAGDKWFDVTVAAGTSVLREFRAPRAH
ncbi:serine/threonine-protein kinase [Pyxidicoccus sp. MSG2]|uniref:serine/threonine-protein kinase n=1 Tax=Pyxidicoccus sp. MSG2 TaxID=2996790 RepID=UPI00226F1569|nr:serine/threonine protein kinase [Pyxidicoccus sp. MSG2]MCY1014920.1 protein kinase [Pyxidicoccus sp. MSG2]